jgi:hypothetical protein
MVLLGGLIEQSFGRRRPFLGWHGGATGQQQQAQRQ